MARVSLRKNPLLAALLGTLATGLGHLYLRRWVRALGWLSASFAATVLFVPESTLSAVSSGTLVDPFSLLPLVLVTGISVLDAYLVANAERRSDDARASDAAGATEADESPACPACGKPVDPDIGFCHWCTTEFEAVDDAGTGRVDERGDE
ncbi:zinc ribbon domain-containing protein [Halorubrum ezzemoulense]|uniref:zinc ribbon domain-containing protein n=1 Tax=Halorubrum ezzemoulense TaxID=337243 RepID=UPI002331573A|nr:zinc ribbon domain-containing protein [Halorubrum ezzemoulense]MDB9280015.1 zinc ribbon domain-containing protein [Halorubrum ezzemoulense]MDB9283533.1 zinc ribbon domain-containing protein [Halorubrum ezzemoulense]